MHDNDIKSFDIRAYINRVLTDLVNGHHLPHTTIQFEVIIGDSVNLRAEEAMCICQLVKELVHNALRHAFKARASGNIRISLTQKSEHYLLIVADDGIGLSEYREAYSSGSYGFQLIQFFVDQLLGKLAVISSKGTRFEIEFPINR